MTGGYRRVATRTAGEPVLGPSCKLKYFAIGYAAQVGRAFAPWAIDPTLHTETVLRSENRRAFSGERWRWILYVAFAIAGAFLTFVAARAEQMASDHATFRKLIDAYCAAWSTGNTDNPARFYAKEDGLVFYDVAPFAYHGWKEYRDRAQKELFANLTSGTLTAGKDLKVSRHGTVAWTTVSMHFSEKTRDGKSLETDIRYTGIWEKRPAGWLLVHEHLSAPLQTN